ncbi:MULTISPECIES: bifunctional [glutamine synthetase] adenylyltransferase/[glutamine synthetase]-adenylyl-L-tyrosine phosphorylase [unclassified Luteococcus]|uniref:bifunctional [glutamine synthetase] adenylyltransferase/[glutamine synthetase]-adenylyl-L-tyrosine phosphorylase n=1 Tax=unclassified Luteococcus TaxID=2639923 RepID=UPI00313B83E7
MARMTSTPGELARRGFLDVDQAVRDLTALAQRRELPGGASLVLEGDAGWLKLLEASADPDLALLGLNRLDEKAPELLAPFASDPAAGARLATVLGGSQALNQHLVAHPESLQILLADPARLPGDQLRAAVLTAIGVDPADPRPVAADDGAADALRIANRNHLLRIAARDLGAADPYAIVDDVAAELADLADALVEGALAIARSQVPGQEHTRLGIVAMGKCGAQELNYISDVDVIYVAEPADDDTSSARAVEIATRLAAKVSQICSAHSAAGSIWQVDANLRPDGKSGPLVRSLASMETYYAKWAKNWEFQAMLKARAMAGDLEIAQSFVDIVQPHVWRAAEREHFLAETQAMRQRVISLLPAAQATREIKLGAGGLRDVEFSVQLLQLVHGRVDERVRGRATLACLKDLVDACYIGRADGAELDAAYRFQRTLEHRIQLYKLRRTHLLPEDERELRVIARGLRMPDGAQQLNETWRATSRRVLRLHQRVFYSPLLAAVTRLNSDELKLTPEQAGDRLRVLGFQDPKAALQHIEALSTGVNRRTEIQRQLLPAMLAWLAEGPNPDLGLLSFRQVSEALGNNSPWYLRAMRDEGEMAERLARILSSSRLAVDLLKRAPEMVRVLAKDDELHPRARQDVLASMLSAAKRHDQTADAMASVRAIRRSELFRLAVGDILGVTTLDELGIGLSDLAGATIDAALTVARREVPDAPELGVVALGRWGGGEMGLGSDCDAMFVMADSDDQEAGKRATQLIGKLRTLLATRGPDPALEIDVDLRPEGKNGPMVRSLSSLASYYQRWSVTWEAQALLRAAHGAGDPDLTARALELVNPLRWPVDGLERSRLNEIRKLKSRMEKERIPRGTDPRRNTKLGPGGLSDVEWTVQVLQLQHAHELPGLRTTATLPALHAATEAGLVEPADAQVLEEAWRLASRLRNKIMLVRGRANDAIPGDAREADAVATMLGYDRGQVSQLLDDYRRTTRRASQAVEKYFWGAAE